MDVQPDRAGVAAYPKVTERERGDAVIHPGAVIFVAACKNCTFYGPDGTNWMTTCPDCGGTEWWSVEALVQHVR